MLRIRVRTPTDPDLLYEAPEPGPVRFGRDSDNHLVLDATYISRSQGEFRFEDGRWFVSSWGSRTPLERLRGGAREELPQRALTPLSHGDVLQLLHTRIQVEIRTGSAREIGEETQDPTEIRAIAPLTAAVVHAGGIDWPASEGAVLALLDLMAARLPGVSAHAWRVGHFAAVLAATLDSKLATALVEAIPETLSARRALRLAGWLHDIGKLGLPGARAATGSDETAERVGAHALLGAAFAQALCGPMLGRELSRWIAQHHERLDGSGQPEGLSADALSTAVRILQVADVFDSAASGQRPPRPTPCAFGAWRQGRECPSSDLLAPLDLAAGLDALERHADAGRLDADVVSLWMAHRLWEAPCALHADEGC